MTLIQLTPTHFILASNGAHIFRDGRKWLISAAGNDLRDIVRHSKRDAIAAATRLDGDFDDTLEAVAEAIMCAAEIDNTHEVTRLRKAISQAAQQHN